MRSLFISITLFVGLCACEAPLFLDGVETSKQAPVRRTDTLMAAVDNGNKSIIVGLDGLILTADSGTDNWHRYQIESSPALIDATICQNGMVVVLAMERKIFISNDDGLTWYDSILPTPEPPQAVTCNLNGTIWVAGSFSTILSTTNDGASWIDHSLKEDIILSTIQFLDEEKGIITGEFGTVLLTDDGGETWVFSEPIPNEFFPLASLFKDHQQGWVTGLNGIIYFTNDGGISWQQEKTHINAPLFGISLKDNKLIVVGDYGTIIHKNIDGSIDSWELLEIPVKSRFFFRVGIPVKDNKLLIAGGAGFLKLLDLGQH